MAKMTKTQQKELTAKKALWLCLHIINEDTNRYGSKASDKTRLFISDKRGTIDIYNFTDDLALNMVEFGRQDMPFITFVNNYPVVNGTHTYFGTLQKILRGHESWFSALFIEKFGKTVEEVLVNLDLWCDKNFWPDHFVDGKTVI